MKLAALIISIPFAAIVPFLMFYWGRYYRYGDSMRQFHRCLLAFAKELRIDLANSRFTASSALFAEAAKLSSSIPDQCDYIVFWEEFAAVWRQAVNGKSWTDDELNSLISEINRKRQVLKSHYKPTLKYLVTIAFEEFRETGK